LNEAGVARQGQEAAATPDPRLRAKRFQEVQRKLVPMRDFRTALADSPLSRLWKTSRGRRTWKPPSPWRLEEKLERMMPQERDLYLAPQAALLARFYEM
jgi:hypothetical protein